MGVTLQDVYAVEEEAVEDVVMEVAVAKAVAAVIITPALQRRRPKDCVVPLGTMSSSMVKEERQTPQE